MSESKELKRLYVSNEEDLLGADEFPMCDLTADQCLAVVLASEADAALAQLREELALEKAISAGFMRTAESVERRASEAEALLTEVCELADIYAPAFWTTDRGIEMHKANAEKYRAFLSRKDGA
jgi:hypothetical protein